jgi:dynactin-6
VPPNTRLPDFTIVYSGSEHRIDKTLQLRPELLEANQVIHSKKLDMFKKLIPNHVSKWAA